MNEEAENIDEPIDIVEAEVSDDCPDSNDPENDVNLNENSPIDINVSVNPEGFHSNSSGNLQESFMTSNSVETNPDTADYPNRTPFLEPEFRRRFPGSPEFRAYIDRLGNWNQATFITNRSYMDTMRRQSQMEFNAYVEHMQREEQQRLARLEAANMLFVFYIPPIWKRAIAELIDFFILLIIKLIVTFLILDTFNITTNLSKLNISQWVDNPHLAAQLSTEIALLEIPFRVIVVIYETYFSVKYAGTPGKRLMGLRVIYVRELRVMDDDVLRRLNNDGRRRAPRSCVRVFPADVLPLRFALMRSVLKNAFVGLLMSPVCFSFIFVNQNRTGYDVMTNSMVVEFKANTNQPGPIWN